jgi:ABC-type taurine transport system ATPase subunit
VAAPNLSSVLCFQEPTLSPWRAAASTAYLPLRLAGINRRAMLYNECCRPVSAALRTAMGAGASA